MIGALLWDNDGVLVETEHLYFEATRRVLATVGVALSEDDYRELFLVQGTGAWHLAAARGVDAATVERLKTERNQLYGRLIEERPRVLPGVPAVLEDLHGRFTMGIVTSSRREHFETIHRRTGLLGYFDFVVTADECPRTKPCPDPYLQAVARSGVAPASCLAIEDSARGLQAAVQAGVPCVVIPSGLTASQTFPGAAAVLDSVRDLPAFLGS